MTLKYLKRDSNHKIPNEKCDCNHKIRNEKCDYVTNS
jgi:hypothetical protein